MSRHAVEQNSAYNLVIVDRQTLGEQYEYLAKAVSKNQLLSNTRLILISEVPLSDYDKHLYKSGYRSYLTRPVKPSDFSNVLSRLIEENGDNSKPRNGNEFRGDGKDLLLDLRDRKILLVEDNEINQIITKAFLEKFHCIVTTVVDGREALSKVKTDKRR